MRSMLTALIVSTLSLAAFGQSTWHVDLSATPPGDGSQASPYVSIQQAIAAPTTVHGDTVLVAPGDYVETLDFLGKSLSLRASAGPLETTLRPTDPSDTVVTIGDPDQQNPPAELEGFAILRDLPHAAIGVLVLETSQAFLTRCIVAGHATGVFNNYDAVLHRCTVTGNLEGLAGSSSGIHSLSNTIVHGNLAADLAGSPFGPCYSATYCDLRPDPSVFVCGSDLGNIDLDPLFWDSAIGDYRLRYGSPCIDTGHPSQLDPDGSRSDMGALPYDPFWAPGTGTSCFGNALTCPCGNGGSGDGGCDIPQATGGIELAILNFAPDGSGGGTAQFLGTGYSPNGQPGSTLIRSPALEPAPVVFGDGLRCITAAGLARVGAVVASGGTSLHTISHGVGAGLFHYQVWVRSQPAGFCNPAAFNLSNVVSVTW